MRIIWSFLVELVMYLGTSFNLEPGHEIELLRQDKSRRGGTALCYRGLLDFQGFCVKRSIQPDRNNPK